MPSFYGRVLSKNGIGRAAAQSRKQGIQRDCVESANIMQKIQKTSSAYGGLFLLNFLKNVVRFVDM